MYIHPLEALGYYCILYSAPFVIPMHSYSFVLYMILMGLTGVLDHCGVKLAVPGVYDTTHHGKCQSEDCAVNGANYSCRLASSQDAV